MLFPSFIVHSLAMSHVYLGSPLWPISAHIAKFLQQFECQLNRLFA